MTQKVMTFPVKVSWPIHFFLLFSPPFYKVQQTSVWLFIKMHKKSLKSTNPTVYHDALAIVGYILHWLFSY
jgi:hypothetical protein